MEQLRSIDQRPTTNDQRTLSVGEYPLTATGGRYFSVTRAERKLVAKLQAMRRAVLGQPILREDAEEYSFEPGTPFD
jgi:hypothetical protein